MSFFVFQAEDGIRYLVRSRGLGDVYKRQAVSFVEAPCRAAATRSRGRGGPQGRHEVSAALEGCLLYTSDAADERSSGDLGGSRIIKKKRKSLSRMWALDSQ